MPEHDGETDDGYRMSRRSALSALGVGTGAVLGLRGFSGTVAAWETFHVCFRGCSEVWMSVGEGDVGREPPTVAYVIVESDGEAVCRTVEFTDANVTTVPGQFGDAPVVKYAPGGTDKILGVVEVDYGTQEPVWCVTVNENNCANTPNTPEVWDAPCVPEGHPVCPEGDYCGGTGRGSSGGQGDRQSSNPANSDRRGGGPPKGRGNR